jgi:hypothetical protein
MQSHTDKDSIAAEIASLHLQQLYRAGGSGYLRSLGGLDLSHFSKEVSLTSFMKHKWCTPKIPAFGKQRQEDQKFDAVEERQKKNLPRPGCNQQMRNSIYSFSAKPYKHN